MFATVFYSIVSNIFEMTKNRLKKNSAFSHFPRLINHVLKFSNEINSIKPFHLIKASMIATQASPNA